jgi:hypothetical protein
MGHVRERAPEDGDGQSAEVRAARREIVDCETMKSTTDLLFIEPERPRSLSPRIDTLTRRMAAALRRATEGDQFFGYHICICGAHSTNTHYFLPDGHMTNSLCVHYIAYHREEVPAEQIRRVEALTCGEVEPSEEELFGALVSIDKLRQSLAEFLPAYAAERSESRKRQEQRNERPSKEFPREYPRRLDEVVPSSSGSVSVLEPILGRGLRDALLDQQRDEWLLYFMGGYARDHDYTLEVTAAWRCTHEGATLAAWEPQAMRRVTSGPRVEGIASHWWSRFLAASQPKQPPPQSREDQFLCRVVTNAFASNAPTSSTVGQDGSLLLRFDRSFALEVLPHPSGSIGWRLVSPGDRGAVACDKPRA